MCYLSTTLDYTKARDYYFTAPNSNSTFKKKHSLEENIAQRPQRPGFFLANK